MAFDKRKALQKALVYTQQGRWDKAIGEYQAILKADPNDLTIYNTLGDLYARIGAKDQAIAHYQKLGDHYRTDGIAFKAIAVYKKIIKLDPAYIPAYLACADLYSEQGLMGEAKVQLLLVAEHYLKEGGTRKALDIYQKLSSLDPANLALALKLAEMFLKEGLQSEALAQLHRVAEGYLQNGQLTDAQRVFRRMLQIQPQCLEARLGLGRIYYQTGSFSEALEELRLATDLRDPNLLQMLANSYRKTGQREKAEEVFRRILSIDPYHEEARQTLGRLYLEAKDSEAAYREFRLLAERYMEEGNAEKAISLLLEVVGSDPHNFRAREMVAELYRKSGNESRSIEEYERIAEIHQEQGRWEEAAKACGRLLEMDPGREDVALRLQGAKGQGLRPVELEVSAPSLEEVEAVTEKPGNVLEEAPIETFVEEAEVHPSVGTELVPEALLEEEDPRVSEILTEVDTYLKYSLMDKAIDRLQQALKLAPYNLQAHSYLKKLYLEKGMIAEAIQEALTLAHIYSYNGLKAQAAYELRKALELDPENREAGARLRELTAQADEPVEPLKITIPTLEAYVQEEGLPAELEEVLEIGEERTGLIEVQPETPLSYPAVALAEDFAEAEFYFQQGMLQEAQGVYQRILAQDPDNAQARERLAEIEGAGRAREVTEELEVPGITIAEVQEGRFPWEEDLPGEKVIPVFKVAPEAPEPGEGGYVDLASELERELSEEERQRALVEQSRTIPVLEEILQEFQRGVREQLDKEDYETHYNLGIAYKEMDLLDEAIEEFRLAASDPSRALSCANLLGLCYLAKGKPEQAVPEFLQGLRIPGHPPEDYRGLKYELAMAYEATGDLTKALEILSGVYGESPTFRDVKERVQDLRRRLETQGPESPEPKRPPSTAPKPIKRKISFI